MVYNGTIPTNMAFYVKNATANIEITNIMISTSNDTTYEPYTNGASPNPDYPQEIHNVSGDNTIKIYGGDNLFDKENVNLLNAYLDMSTNKLLSSSQNKTIYIECEANETYTILKQEGKRFRVGTTASTPEINSVLDNTIENDTGTKIEITTGNTAQYLVVYLCNLNLSGEISYQTAINSLIINNTQSQLISLGVGNNKFDAKIEQGAINADTNQTYDSCKTSNATRIRTIKLIRLDTSKTYTLSCKAGYNVVIQAFNSDKKLYIVSGTTNEWASSKTFTNIPYIAIAIRTTDNSNITPSEIDNVKCMLNIGSSPETYEPYKPLELNKIGNYQDYFYKTDKWYLHKEIKKIVLDENEDISSNASFLSIGRFRLNSYTDGIIGSQSNAGAISNYFKGVYAVENGNIYLGNDGKLNLINTTYTNDLAGFKTWLGTNKPIAYYVLATPTYTEITDSTLISQLEAIKNMTSYDGTTNISQENNDLGFILDIKAIKEI